MTEPKLTYYLFDRIPGVWKGWTLAVLAVSEHDAREYMKANYKSGIGRLVRKSTSGIVKADCGALTTEAHKIIQRNQQTAKENLL